MAWSDNYLGDRSTMIWTIWCRTMIMQSVAGDTEPRAWQRMLSGRRLDLLDPSPLDIEIEDIAHGLARVARWNGQTDGEHAFSVAEHSLLVETHRRPSSSPSSTASSGSRP